MFINEFMSQRKPCGYFNDRLSDFRYFHIQDCSSHFYGGLLERGWRRFGNYFFVPVCQGCTQCISVRTLVDDFKISKSFKRVLKNNENTSLIVNKPSASIKHLELYDKYHWNMHYKKGWEHKGINYKSYCDMFVDGAQDFGYEFLYKIGDRLVGVGLVDILSAGISAVYFFYDHDFEHLSLGTFNILMQINAAKNMGIKYFYPGYWIKEHYSMGYKKRFRPYEYLIGAPDIFDIPQWELYKDEQENF